MTPKLAPEDARFSLADPGCTALSHETFGRHDVNHAVANHGIKGIGDAPRRDLFWLLDYLSRNLDAFPNKRAPSIWIRNGRPALTMQAAPPVGVEPAWAFGNPAHVLMRNKPTRTAGDHPKAAQILCAFLPSKHVVQILVHVKRRQVVRTHRNLVEVRAWQKSRVAAQA